MRSSGGSLLEDRQTIHNAIIPTAPLSAGDVAERSTRHRLTVGFVDGELVGNATVRPPLEPDGVATVIVRILPEHRRRRLGTAYFEAELAQAIKLGTSNQTGRTPSRAPRPEDRGWLDR